MATLENFDPRTLALDFSGINQAINQRQKLALLQQAQDTNIDVAQREIALKELQRLDDLEAQQGIQNVLQQQLGGGTPPLTAPQGIVAGEGITPGGSIGVEPSRVKPATQSVLDTERKLAVGLLGIKGGREAFAQLSNIFKSGREDEMLAAKKDIEDTQRFALKLDRAKTRKARNKLLEDEQSRRIIDTGNIDQELLRMRNMSDDELQGEIISDLAVGESLTKLVDNRLAPPEVAPDFTLSAGQVRFGPGGKEIASVAATPPKPEQETTLIRNLRSIGIDPLSDEGKKIVRESLTKSGTQININEGLAGFKVPKSFMFDKDETGKITGIKPIPGSKADRLGAGDAAKVQMLRTAQKAAKGIRELIFDKFDKKGVGIELNRTNLFNAGFNSPFSDGRKLRNKMEFGIQGITRGETGAAMPPAEVDNTRIRFMPNIFDTAEIARLKLEMFDDFLSGTLQLIDPSGRFNEDRFGNPVKPTFDKSGNAVELGQLNESKFDAELQRRISGTAQGTATENPETIATEKPFSEMTIDELLAVK